MTNGSIDSRSSASTAVEFMGVRVPNTNASTQSGASARDFDTFFDALNYRSNDSSLGQLKEDGRADSSDVSSRKTDDSNQITSEKREESIQNEACSEEDSSSVNLDESASDASSESNRSEQAVADEKASSKDDAESTDEMSDRLKDSADAASSESKTDADGKQKSKNANTTVVSSDAPKMSSSLSLKINALKQSASTDEGKKGTQKQSTETVVKANVTEIEKANASKVAGKSMAETASLKVDTSKEVKDAGKDVKDAGASSKLLGQLKNTQSVGQKTVSEEGKATLDSETLTGQKKGASKSAKTSPNVVSAQATTDPSQVKNLLKTGVFQEENRSAAQDKDIGIKTAVQAASKSNKMVSESKQSESSSSEKGFLKESSANGTLNRAQSVSSRSDSSGFFQQNHHGNQSPGEQSRGGEQYRQWVESNSDVRAVSQSVQQSDFVDRVVSSGLSSRVMNQIVNHIERMRESEKNRVKVALGSEANGVTVDIRIEGDAIYTSFEGDPEILNQLKEEWADIKDRAAQKGVNLSHPEFIGISYSSSAEGESLLPDDGSLKEDESQSVIQHINNQPVRPGEMTAAAGSSGPVHSYYA